MCRAFWERSCRCIQSRRFWMFRAFSCTCMHHTLIVLVLRFLIDLQFRTARKPAATGKPKAWFRLHEIDLACADVAAHVQLHDECEPMCSMICAVEIKLTRVRMDFACAWRSLECSGLHVFSQATRQSMVARTLDVRFRFSTVAYIRASAGRRQCVHLDLPGIWDLRPQFRICIFENSARS